MRYVARPDIVSGLLLFSVGLFAVLYSFGSYDIGTFRRMGPGLFPLCIGVLICFVGFVIALQGLFSTESFPEFEARPFLFIVGAIAAFAITVDRLGMIPSVVLLVVVASFGGSEHKPKRTAILAAALAAFAVMLFRVGLGMPIPAFKWAL